MRVSCLFSVCLVCLLVTGCSNDASNSTPPPSADGGPGGGGPGFGPGGGQSEPTPVPINDGTVTLSGDNTTIQFVGSHVGDEPNPRTGVFQQFTGKIRVDTESKEVRSVKVEIQAASLATPIDNLTNHLKSPDFLDVREYPTATFVSTSMTPGEAGKTTITGNLTLHGKTKEISIPATATISDDGLILKGEITIDRTDYGMDGVQDRVQKEVAISVFVGQDTQLPTEGGMGGPGGGGERGGRGGGFDPVAIFKQRDTDGDGKLSGDEISDRMQDNIDELDKDQDGAVSLEEFQERVRQFRGRRGGGGGGRGGPGNGGGRGGKGRPQSPGGPPA